MASPLRLGRVGVLSLDQLDQARMRVVSALIGLAGTRIDKKADGPTAGCRDYWSK